MLSGAERAGRGKGGPPPPAGPGGGAVPPPPTPGRAYAPAES
jgi:hypothetical protein